MESDDYHFKFKVVVLGDKAVGKTSFLDCNY
jgi:GTPase SAR1 family protein